MSKRAFDNFDPFAGEYRQIHDRSLRLSGADSDYFTEQKIAEVREIEGGRSARILDLGCGDGNSARFFAKYFSDSEYFGLDVSEKSIAVAKRHETPHAQFAPYNGTDIPFSDNTFDIVFAACVLHHIDRELHEVLLEEVKRVMKGGGRVYIFEHNPFNPVTRRIVKNCPFDEDAVLLSPFYTRRILTKLKFDNVSINYTIFFPRFSLFKKILHWEKYLRWMPFGGQYFANSTKKRISTG